MSRTRIVKGTYTKITGGDHNMYAKGNIVTTAGKSINEFGKEGGVTYGEPKKPPLFPKHFFVKGWWSSDEAGTKEITEALVDDIVYFHVETKNIPDGEVVQMKLYDDDNTEIKEPTEKNENDKDDFIVTRSGNKAGITDKKVNGNKIVIALRLANLEKFITNEADKEVELYYRSSYKGEHVELPRTPSDYLKVKGMPKIIFVNGHWKWANRTFGEYVGPTKPKKPYWDNTFLEATIKYFVEQFNIDKRQTLNNKVLEANELENRGFALYYDGSSDWGFNESGGERFKRGHKFAQQNYEEIIKGLGGEALYFVSHSEGSAYAAGMVDYLYSKGHKIGEHVLLSADEGDEFQINPKIPSYQLTYMFFSSVYNPIMADVKYFKFKRWGSYYAIVDVVVNEHKIKGVSKMGIVRRDDLDWGSVHGSTNSRSIFSRVTDLKEVNTFDVKVEHEKELYFGKNQIKTTNGTKFYRIDDDYIIPNCPPIAKVK